MERYCFTERKGVEVKAPYPEGGFGTDDWAGMETEGMGSVWIRLPMKYEPSIQGFGFSLNLWPGIGPWPETRDCDRWLSELTGAQRRAVARVSNLDRSAALELDTSEQ